MTNNTAPAPHRVSSQNYVASYEAYIAFSALTGVDSAAACGEKGRILYRAATGGSR
jgi:hypothetical protein